MKKSTHHHYHLGENTQTVLLAIGFISLVMVYSLCLLDQIIAILSRTIYLKALP